jgi:galactokinase
VITENARTEQALVAMQNQDVATLSALMKASHQSLKDDFEVSTKELDGIVAIIDDVIGQRGGVRMTGGGFGGCVVALVPTALVESVVDRVKQDYPAQFGLIPEVYLCSPAAGAFRE